MADIMLDFMKPLCSQPWFVVRGSRKEFLDEVCKQAEFLCEHHYIKKSQATYLEHCKSTLPEDNVLILLDFAENYSFIIKDVFQSCHWNNSQACIVYKKIQENLTHESVCIT